MSGLVFTKMVGTGNDFIVIENGLTIIQPHRRTKLIQCLCDRKYGIGADGVLFLEKSKKADLRMRIINSDGSEAEMCGNGARCAVLYAHNRLALKNKKNIRLETRAGIIDSEVHKDSVKVKLTDPHKLKLDIPLVVNGRKLRVNFINTGVPHVVVFTEGLGSIGVVAIGRAIRNHPYFAPRGTNVNFIEVLGKNSIAVRTYERGVEDETLACGTGSTASALIFASKTCCDGDVVVHTRSNENLHIYFNRQGNSFRDVWLEGKVSFVFEGKIC
ncbi:MAG TPA: diaminopimelate epimerase [Candidatus Omnitrophota bacterium]|nr:diaminopimelate epimerase [Candidatus Omnitrophota bacterium]HPT06551.1 diaminopimelate epimerase [Candidatus Omnitrophota bacterium]